jgi:hypothetical protein
LTPGGNQTVLLGLRGSRSAGLGLDYWHAELQLCSSQFEWN